MNESRLVSPDRSAPDTAETTTPYLTVADALHLPALCGPQEMARRPGATVRRVCETCCAAFYSKPSLIAKGLGRYCSKRCSGIARRIDPSRPQSDIESYRRYRERYPARVLAAKRVNQRAYTERHGERARAAQRRRMVKHNARHKPWRLRKYYASNFAYDSNRRAEVFGVSERLSGRDVRPLDGPCAYCGQEARGWDHVVPLSRGGRNHVSNLVSCCDACNRRKHARTPTQAGMQMVAR